MAASSATALQSREPDDCEQQGPAHGESVSGIFPSFAAASFDPKRISSAVSKKKTLQEPVGVQCENSHHLKTAPNLPCLKESASGKPVVA